MVKIAESKIVLLLELFVVVPILYAISTYGQGYLQQLVPADSPLYGMIPFVVLAVLAAAYEYLSPQGKARLDELRGIGKNNSGELSPVVAALIVVAVAIIAIVLVAVYVLHIDVISVAAGVVLIALGALGYKTISKPPVSEDEPKLIGVSIVSYWDGALNKYVDLAVVKWQQWIEAYGWSKVVIGSVPSGLLRVEFTDNLNGAFVYYDRQSNTIYADEAAPMFREVVKRQKQERQAVEYKRITASSSPMLTCCEILGQPAKDLALEGVPVADREVAWENFIDGKTPDDLVRAQQVYTTLTGYNP